MMSAKNSLKKVVSFFISVSLLDFLIKWIEFLLYYLSKLLLFKEWNLNGTAIPPFFKHKINYNFWRFNPNEWTFILRGVYARENMFLNCKVLDLCCGDGSYSFLFFADISAKIDAIDFDKKAIKYAKNNYSHPKISFLNSNIITEEFPSNDYDIVVWNAGICYFELNVVHEIIKKIIRSTNNEMILCGMLPLANGHIDHKTEFFTHDEIKSLFDLYFNVVNIRTVQEGKNLELVNFYFSVSKPK